MGELREKIKNHVREKLHPRTIEKFDLLKADMKKRFTSAWLFFLAAVLILNGVIRFFPKLFNIQEYMGFFIFGVILFIIAVIYSFRRRRAVEFKI